MLPILMRTIRVFEMAFTRRIMIGTVRRQRNTIIKRLFSSVETGAAAVDKTADKLLKQETDFNIILEELGKGDEQCILLLKRANSFYNKAKESGYKVPEILTLDNYRTMLIDRPSFWPQYFAYLFTVECIKKNRLKKIQELATIRAENFERKKDERALNPDAPRPYGLWGNQIFRKLAMGYMRDVENYNLLQAHQFSAKLIFDFSYDAYMENKYMINSADQVTKMLGHNRKHINPFHIIMCNLNENSPMCHQLMKAMPDMYNNKFLLADVTDKSYLDLFPREKFVYLSSHSNNELTTLNLNDIYIIGVYNDKIRSRPHSLRFAKQHRLRHAAFPIDRYLKWERGSKSLNLLAVMHILLRQQMYGNWEESLRTVPKRFLYSEYVNSHRLRESETLINYYY